ncbi:unnamed protein product [Xylocopa violacea]|uniref:Uncharacterized protein n=1 Tax=Xylocopa violacea TaxID=135666 RepID=A0ABP1N304_XYLVO
MWRAASPLTFGGLPSAFYGTYRDQNVGERLLESPPKYVALRDLFLGQEYDLRTTPTNRQHSTFPCNLTVDDSYAGGGYRDRRIAMEECEEITSRNPTARRLEYSNFEASRLSRDDFCFDREYPGYGAFRSRPEDRETLRQATKYHCHNEKTLYTF